MVLDRDISLVEDILYAIDNQREVDLILLDFSKAFDTVPHQRLLTKVLYYGINDFTLVNSAEIAMCYT